MFDDITNWERPNVRTKCLSQAEEVGNDGARLRPGYLWFCGQDHKTLGKTTKTDHLTNMLTEYGMVSRFVW